jgi:hemerythrin-like domain-containing protein
MSRELPGHTSPAVGFEVPLAMLSACHGRIEQQCATLRRLVTHLPRHGADAAAREAAAGVMRYFDSAAVHHHADEERDLFPALEEAMAGSDAVCVRELTASLAAEHRELEACWRRVRAALAPLAAGTAASLPAGDVEALVVSYEQHIAREEAELLPMAARLLGDDVQDRIGRAMRARRGIADEAV